MSTTHIEAQATPVHRATRLRRFLNCYWLRPENAFWMALRSKALQAHAFEGPSIDLSCGDGVFSFLHAGGNFAPEFDVFREVGQLDQVRDQFADMFDYLHGDFAPPINMPARWNIDVGTDLKPNLLLKSCALNFYESLVQHDNNEAIPFDDDSFATVHCNSAYWVENIDLFLTEIRRVTRPGGRVLLSVKLSAMREYTLNRHRGQLGQRWLDIIGRGRIESWPSLCDDATWQQRFKSAGLQIALRTPFITRTHAHIWDIGLRPIAPLLVRMANALDHTTRQDIKADWVELLDELLTPLNQATFDLFADGSEPGEVLYELIPA